MCLGRLYKAPRPLLVRYAVLSDPTKEADQVKTTDPHYCVNNTGDPGHAAEQYGNEIKIKYANQTPVNGSENGNGKNCVI